MAIWICIIIIAVCGSFIGLRMGKAAGDYDRSFKKALLDEGIKKGCVKLPDCDEAYECYLQSFLYNDQFPDCKKCLRNK